VKALCKEVERKGLGMRKRKSSAQCFRKLKAWAVLIWTEGSREPMKPGDSSDTT